MMTNLRNALATVKSFVADERTQISTASTIGLAYQIWLMKKFYSQMIPAIKTEDNKKLKAWYIILSIGMTGVYGFNVISIIGSWISSFRLHKEKKEAEEAWDREVERFHDNMEFMDKIHELATASEEEECE